MTEFSFLAEPFKVCLSKKTEILQAYNICHYVTFGVQENLLDQKVLCEIKQVEPDFHVKYFLIYFFVVPVFKCVTGPTKFHMTVSHL